MKKEISIDMTGIWELAIFVVIIFLVLKLTKLITWSWVWVLSPLWIAMSIWFILFLVLVILMVTDKLRDFLD